jgi:hypothetical protein
MITLGIILLILYVISIYKLKEENFNSNMVEEVYVLIAALGTIVIAITLLILILIYLP